MICYTCYAHHLENWMKHRRFMTRNGIRVNAAMAEMLEKLGHETRCIWDF